jgi:dihydroorotase
VEAVREGLRDGTIDIIATDHAPHEMTSKDVEYTLATYGISGFETALALSLGLVHDGVLSLRELLRKMTVNPARLLGLPFGELAPGRPADLIVFNTGIEWTVDRNAFVSKGKNSPFHGWKVQGKNLLTVAAGRITYRDTLFLPEL